MIRTPIIGLAAGALLLFAGVGVAAEEPLLLSDAAEGLLELEGESELVVRGRQMTLSVRVGKSGELRYMARSRDNKREERPIGLWLEGRTLRLEALPGDEEQPLVVEVAISPELAVEIEVEDSKVALTGLRGRVKVKGPRTDLDARSLAGSLDAELSEGSVRVVGAADGASIEGTKLQGTVRDVRGQLTLDLTDSEIAAEQIIGALDADLVRTKFSTDLVNGKVQIYADGGSLELNGLRHGGELKLEDTVAVLSNCGGRLTVDTNAEVRFSDLAAHTTITSFGGDVRGVGSTATLQVRADNARVVLENLSGETRIDGDDLGVRLKGVKGALKLTTRSSTVFVEEADAVLDLNNDFGDLTLRDAKQAVQIVNMDGNVSVTEMRAALQVKADGEQVDVGWTEMKTEDDSVIDNQSGDVRISLHPSVGCSLNATSRYGRVESSIDGIRVADDGGSAAGVLRRRSRPRIQVRSGRDVYLGSQSAKPAGQ